MTEQNAHLGGRLPLLQAESLNPEQRALYDQLRSTMVPWATESGFTAETAEGELVGPFNALLYSPAMGAAQMAYLKAERESTSLSPRVREVVILTVGSVWKASYELYAHRAVAAKAGLSAEAIESLACGDAATGLSDKEVLAQRLVYKLVSLHTLEPPLYEEAVAAFGHTGVIDMLHLAGLYMTVSALLNAFAVPAGEQQLGPL